MTEVRLLVFKLHKCNIIDDIKKEKVQLVDLKQVSVTPIASLYPSFVPLRSSCLISFDQYVLYLGRRY